jgi:hypothetical protein
MDMPFRGTLALTVFVGTFGLSVTASGGATVTATGLSPSAQIPYEEYRDTTDIFRYKAFAIEPESGEWGQSTTVSPPAIAIDLAIEDCQRRAARDCQIYAVGDIIVLGLADWKTNVALRLYEAKSDATNNDLEVVTSWENGADANALRRIVLLAAATVGSTDVITAMLDRGINVNVNSDVGATALSYAASRGNREAVALLLERGANVNARNGANLTVLSVAMVATNFARPRDYLTADHAEIIRLLVDAGGIE